MLLGARDHQHDLFEISGEPGGEQVIELTSRRLSHIFGKEVMSDLYLKGRVRISATLQQMALLRGPEDSCLSP
ncbi:hypothetical protein [Deinococcus marmoris]|uniref:Uncharacterized protein n=1 Tax=Deinococcus marmoris TaxID=249408 RepID=A0A1U7NV22_9DEIO|nr:hypothetical protein [Deinococcus marmoris]OLV16764.1 hypothetical protein BOO71_0010876 [Deinococcus marmoris]